MLQERQAGRAVGHVHLREATLALVLEPRPLPGRLALAGLGRGHQARLRGRGQQGGQVLGDPLSLDRAHRRQGPVPMPPCGDAHGELAR